MRVYELALEWFRKEVKATPSLKDTRLKLDPAFNPKNENYYRLPLFTF